MQCKVCSVLCSNVVMSDLKAVFGKKKKIKKKSVNFYPRLWLFSCEDFLSTYLLDRLIFLLLGIPKPIKYNSFII